MPNECITGSFFLGTLMDKLEESKSVEYVARNYNIDLYLINVKGWRKFDASHLLNWFGGQYL